MIKVYNKEEFPTLLRHLPAESDNNPIHIYLKGEGKAIEDKKHERILIIGSRTPTPSDMHYCREIVSALAKKETKPVIISGLAMGTDTVVHKSALENGLSTYGVMATGIDEVYPYVNRNLAKEMTEKGGGLITGFEPKTAPIAFNFIQRTKLMVEMADKVIIVCSKKKGSSMVAAHYAKELDLPVFAVPGRPDDIMHQGCNDLIRQRTAEILTNTDQI